MSTASATDIDTPVWLRVLLGIVLILAGLIVLGDVMIATVISTLLIGVVAIVGGVFEIIHAFWTRGWGGFVRQIVLRLLHAVPGGLRSEPAGGG